MRYPWTSIGVAATMLTAFTISARRSSYSEHSPLTRTRRMPPGMLLFDVALLFVDFYPEALKARNIFRRKLVAT